jgi:hypothetical protein
MIPVKVEMDTSVFQDEKEPLGDLSFTYYLPIDNKYTPDMAARRVIAADPLQIALLDKGNENEGNDGYITINVLDGVPPFIFTWSNGETTQNLVGLAAGSYSVSVEDSGSPKRYGRLLNIEIIEQPLGNVEYAGAGGGFEEYDTTSWRAAYNWGQYPQVMSIVNSPKRSGSKALKITGQELTDEYGYPSKTAGFFSPNTPVNVTPDVRYKVGMWIYITSASELWKSSGSGGNTDYTRLAILPTVSIQTSWNTVEFTALANPDIRNSWQYLEAILTPGEDWLTAQPLKLEVGYPYKPQYQALSGPYVNSSFYGTSSAVYYDDLTIERIP